MARVAYLEGFGLVVLHRRWVEYIPTGGAGVVALGHDFGELPDAEDLVIAWATGWGVDGADAVMVCARSILGADALVWLPDVGVLEHYVNGAWDVWTLDSIACGGVHGAKFDTSGPVDQGTRRSSELTHAAAGDW